MLLQLFSLGPPFFFFLFCFVLALIFSVGHFSSAWWSLAVCSYLRIRNNRADWKLFVCLWTPECHVGNLIPLCWRDHIMIDSSRRLRTIRCWNHLQPHETPWETTTSKTMKSHNNYKCCWFMSPSYTSIDK